MEAHPKLKPVDAPTRGVYFAGCVESPKDVKDSVTQAGAAASRAGNLLGAGEVKVEAITAVLDAELCNRCGICAQVCPFNAIEAANKKVKQDLPSSSRRPAPAAAPAPRSARSTPSPCATSRTSR